MKKICSVIMFGLLMLTVMQSCRMREKKESVDTRTVTAVLKPNENYTYTLPPNTSTEPYRVAQQPAHAGVSALGMNAAGETIYQYTPAKDYSGTDQVVISNEGGKSGHRGKCGDDDKRSDTRVVISFSMVNPEGGK